MRNRFILVLGFLVGLFVWSGPAEAQDYMDGQQIKQALVNQSIQFTAPNGRQLTLTQKPGGELLMDVGSRKFKERWWINKKNMFCRSVTRQNRNICSRVATGHRAGVFIFYRPNGSVLYEAKLLGGGGGEAQAAQSAEQEAGPEPDPDLLFRAHKFIERHDQDGDGRLSANEFPRTKRAFDTVDANGDGIITPREMANREKTRTESGKITKVETGEEKVSLEAAQDISEKLSGESFTPPPGTIDDITAILNQQQVQDTTDFSKLMETADAEPAGQQGKALVEFYYRRAQARIDTGRTDEALLDIRQAYKFLQETDYPGRNLAAGVKTLLASTERAAGNFANAISLYEIFIKEENRFGDHINLVKTLILQGDIDRAKAAGVAAHGRLDHVLGKSGAPQRSKSLAGVFKIDLEISLLEAEGSCKQAEPLRRQLIAMEQQVKKIMRNRPDRIYYMSKTRLAANLMAQGRHLEAEVMARDALLGTLAKNGKWNRTAALSAQWLGRIFLAQGRSEDGEALSRESLKILDQIGMQRRSPLSAAVQRSIGAAAAERGEWEQASQAFDRLAKDLADSPKTYDRVASLGVALPLSMIRTGRAGEAVLMLERYHQRSVDQYGEQHFLTAEKQGGLAVAQDVLGHQAKALELYRASAEVLMSAKVSSDTGAGERMSRRRRIAVILESYLAFLDKVRAGGVDYPAEFDPVAEAFRVADYVRSGAVRQALAASSARAAAGNPELAELVRKEQDAQKQIAAMLTSQTAILSAPREQQNTAVLETLTRNLGQLRAAREAILAEISERFPDYAALISPKPASVEHARKFMRADEAMVAAYVTDEAAYIWALAKTGPVRMAVAPLGREQLSKVVASLRAALDPAAEGLDDIPAFNAGLSHRLYRRLFKPVEAAWKNAVNLLAVVHGPLGQLPLSVLVTAPPQPPSDAGLKFSDHKNIAWLARTHSVSLLPSVTSLAALRALPKGTADRKPFAAFGDPYFNVNQMKTEAAETKRIASDASLSTRSATDFTLRSIPKTRGEAVIDFSALPRLPDTLEEVHSIARVFGGNARDSIFTGERASERVIKSTNLSKFRVLAFATHGLVAGDLAGLTQPALALSAPQVTGEKGEDGLLTLGEILSLRLDADWVVLSACNTGAADGSNAEAFTGLGRAFFYAGTRAVLLSNWPVETTSARLLTTNLFKYQAEDDELSRAQALRRSMLTLIDGPGFKDGAGKELFSYAHPIFWAPFTLVGDGGG